MRTRTHRRYVSRLVYWANTGAAWYDLARNAGYEVDWRDDGAAKEARLSWDDCVVAVMRRVPDGEWYGFVWVPEARSPLWRETLWRMRHPRTARYARTVTRA